MAVPTATDYVDVHVVNNEGQESTVRYPEGHDMVTTLVNKQMRGELATVEVSGGASGPDATFLRPVQRRPRADAILFVDPDAPTDDPVMTVASGRVELAPSDSSELDGLRLRAQEAGVDVKPAWREKRLREEIAKAEAPQQG